jgi:hypothetical protein
MTEPEELPESGLEKQQIKPWLVEALADAAQIRVMDRATRALAIRYAELLDDAAVAEKYHRAVRMVGDAVTIQSEHMGETAANQLLTAWTRIESALAEHTVASDLGPKLLAALTALSMTPAARAPKAAPGRGEGGNAPAAELTPLEKARERARRRKPGA